MVEDDRTGFLAAPDDHLEFARLIAKCLADPPLCARLGAGGREFVSRFSIPGHVRDLLAIYARVGGREIGSAHV